MTSTTATGTRTCDLCLGTGHDDLVHSTCGYSSGTGTWTPSPYRSLPKAMAEWALPEFGTGTGSTTEAAPAPRTWGWTKFDGEWAALAPVGATVEAGMVTLTTKAGKTSEVYVTGKVLARLRYGLVVEMGTAPAPAATAAAPAEELAPAAPAAAPAATDGLDLSGLVSGRYAVPGGDTRLKLEVDVVTKGKWAGWVFVRNAAEYGPASGERLGAQRPGQTYKGEAAAALAAVLADPKAAMAAYGHLTGTCGACGRHLEDEASIAAGMGPVCAKKW